jgi:RNA polymerase sigma-70 factor (ECF subfamily)
MVKSQTQALADWLHATEIAFAASNDRRMSADEEDVAAVLDGDVQRFERIVKRWQKPLVNLAWRFVRDEARAEDLAQEAFLKCYRSLRQWRREAQFSTWLFSVAISVYRSHLRKLEPVTAAFEEMVSHDGTEERIATRQRDEIVRRAVRRLPALFRDPLLVFYFQEQDLATTARILGLNEGTLKARLHRARAALREMLAGEDV